MYFKYHDDYSISTIDSELFRGSLWVGLEQSFYILDYNSAKIIQRKKARYIATHLNRGMWDSVLVNDATRGWKDYIFHWIDVEAGNVQYEVNLPLPFIGNFSGLYAVMKTALKALHEEAQRRGVLISTVPIQTQQGLFLTDNHVTVSHFEIPVVDAYNNLRSKIPEILAHSANSPLQNGVKSLRNLVLDQLYPNPHVGHAIRSLAEYKRFSEKQKPEMGRLIEFEEKFSQTQRKNFIEFLRSKEGKRLKKKMFPKAKMKSYVKSTPIPKPVDVCIKGDGDRIEIVVPDGSTCAYDIVLNAALVMLAAYTPSSTYLPKELEMNILQGRKTYAAITGEAVHEEPTEDLLKVWRRLDKISRRELLSDPLALYLYFRDKGCLFKDSSQKLYGDRLVKWKVPAEIIEKIKNLSPGENPANTFTRYDKPEYKAFDNLSENVSWIRR